MSLRTKLTILSFTLMSLMTIPTLAENCDAPTTSRIENEFYHVLIKTPEGWSETKDFNQAVPDTFKLHGLTFRGMQFINPNEFQGCAVFFAKFDSDQLSSDDGIASKFTQAQELVFPGSEFKVAKLRVDGSFGANAASSTAKIEVKGLLEGNLVRESGDTSKITITGGLHADSTKGNFVVGTGQFISEGYLPCAGTLAMQLGNEYEIIIVMWGVDENFQIEDIYRFLKGITVTEKAPAEPVEEVIVISEPVVVEVKEPITILPVVVEETASVTTEPVVTPAPVQPVVVEEAAKPVTTEPVDAPVAVQPAIVEEVAKPAPVTAEPAAAAPVQPVIVEEAAKTVATEPVAAPVQPVVVEEMTKPTPETTQPSA